MEQQVHFYTEDLGLSFAINQQKKERKPGNIFSSFLLASFPSSPAAGPTGRKPQLIPVFRLSVGQWGGGRVGGGIAGWWEVK